jgi:phosphinothricin acetyltransferase
MAITPVSIRIAAETDAGQLLQIYAPYVRDTAVSFEYTVPSVDEFQKRIRLVLQHYPYIVAERDGSIIGYSYASAFKERPAYCHSVEMTVYIRQNCRGQGAGRILYDGMERILRLQGILNMNACIGYTSREHDVHLTNASMHFHERMGFRLVGRFTACGYKFGEWYDMIWMEKLIDIHGPAVPVFRPFPDIMAACGLPYVAAAS